MNFLEKVGARHSGKKFAGLMIGLGAIFLLLATYSEFIGSPLSSEVATVIRTAMLSVAIAVAGASVGQGIADSGKSAKNGQGQG